MRMVVQDNLWALNAAESSEVRRRILYYCCQSCSVHLLHSQSFECFMCDMEVKVFPLKTFWNPSEETVHDYLHNL